MIYTRKGEGRHTNTALLLISAAFLVGGLLGHWAAGKLPAEVYVRSFLDAVQGGTLETSVRRELWMVLRWPLGILVLQFLPMAGITIPAFLGLRGFLLSYSISAFVQEGIGTAVLLFGPTCILTLPVLFLLSTGVLLRKAGEVPERRPAVVLACLLALCLCILLDLTVIPEIMG